MVTHYKSVRGMDWNSKKIDFLPQLQSVYKLPKDIPVGCQCSWTYNGEKRMMELKYKHQLCPAEYATNGHQDHSENGGRS